jgi:chorismate mutase / prephenate dehydratase
MAKSSKTASASKRLSQAGSATAKSSPTKAGDTTSTADIQRQIDELDRQLLSIAEERCTLVQSLAKAEPASAISRMSIASENVNRVAVKAARIEDKIHSDQKQSILRHVASVCLATVQKTRVAFLGPEHSYSHLAAIKFFGEGATFAPVSTIAAVFDSVSRNEAIAGIVPIENSTDGGIVDTLSMFVRRKMHVCGEVLVPIHHNLLSRTPRHQITEIYSKPQALSQCRNWLSNHLPNARLIDMSSTTAAARLAADRPGAAAVASIEAAREFSLDIVDANIEDNPNNVTRFAVLGREQPPPSKDDKTAILFQVCHEPGALADAMTIFKKAKLNLTWIESFPIPERRSEYVFFIELTGHQAEENVANAIAALAKRSERLDVLGSYPRAELSTQA